MRSFVCEPSDYGSGGDEPCRAQALLTDLAELLTELEGEVNTAEGDRAELMRSARYCMYRKYVSHAWGHLGVGVRMRIPLCVVSKIRHTFRAPGCACAEGHALANCEEHGYTGHRDIRP